MNYYQKIYEAVLSGASRAFRKHARKFYKYNNELTKTIDSLDGDSSDSSEDWKIKHLSSKSQKYADKKARAYNSIPKKDNRETYRDTNNKYKKKQLDRLNKRSKYKE